MIFSWEVTRVASNTISLIFLAKITCTLMKGTVYYVEPEKLARVAVFDQTIEIVWYVIYSYAEEPSVGVRP